MSLVKAFGNLTITRSYVSIRTLHPKKFTSILDGVPPRPRNAWQIYIRENVNKYKNESGKANLALATKELSAKWKNFSAAEKQPYVATFEKESADHVAKYEDALRNASPNQFILENSLRKKYNLTTLKDPRRPKRPKNAFFFYLEHLRNTKDPIYTENDPRTRVSMAAKHFKQLSKSESKIFHEKASAASEQYKKDIEAYNNSSTESK